MTESDDIAIIKTVCVLIFAVISVIFVYTICFIIIVPQIQETNREVMIFDFYQNITHNYANRSENQHNLIYFIGSSQIKQDIDAFVVEDILAADSDESKVYNLGIDADCPLRRLLEMNSLVASHPNLVIIGISYYELGDAPIIDDHDLSALSEKFTLDNYSKSLFSETEIHSLYDKKNSFLSYFSSGGKMITWISEIPGNHEKTKKIVKTGMNFKNPYDFTSNTSREELLKKIYAEKGSEDSFWLTKWTTVHETDNSEKKALNYFVKKLQENNISVIIMNMPLNPMLSEKEPTSTKKNYSDDLNTTGAPWYDFEKVYSEENFMDLTHLNGQGREKFSHEMARLIQAEKEKK